jgi:HEAT repeat protein
MDVAVGKRFLLLICCLFLGVGGCASWFQKETPDTVTGVISPTKRINDLRELAKNASQKNPTEKELIAAQLATEIQHEPDPLLRARIVRTLGEYPGPAADFVLRVAVNDSDNDVRTAACESWGKRNTAEAATMLVGVLNGDIEHDVRMAAARALGQSHEQVAVMALGNALDDKDPAMQYRAVISLRQITGQDLGNDVNKWREYVKSGKLAPVQASTSHHWF